MRAFRFGVLVERFGAGGDVLGTAARAEALGYATFLIRDHFVAEPFGHQLAPLTTLAAVAGATRRLRVGTLVLRAAPIVDGVIAYDDEPAVRAPERMARQVEWIREAAGSRFGKIELSTMVSVVAREDRRAAAEELVSSRGWTGLAPEAVLA